MPSTFNHFLVTPRERVKIGCFECENSSPVANFNNKPYYERAVEKTSEIDTNEEHAKYKLKIMRIFPLALFPAPADINASVWEQENNEAHFLSRYS